MKRSFDRPTRRADTNIGSASFASSFDRCRTGIAWAWEGCEHQFGAAAREGAMLAAPSSPVSGIVFVVAVLATSIVLVAGLAWVSRQLLGLPVGTLRTLIAGLLGFVAAYLLGRSLQAAEPGHAVAFFTVVLGVPLIVAMIFIVAAEALVPSGTGPRAAGGDPRRAERGSALTALLADQPDRGAARAGPLPARATARRGCRRRAGSARVVAAACPGRGRGYLHQAGPVAVHSP